MVGEGAMMPAAIKVLQLKKYIHLHGFDLGTRAYERTQSTVTSFVVINKFYDK